jgi:hypothetical protein
MRSRPAIPPIIPPIIAVFWVPEDDDDEDVEVGDCVAIVV